SESDSRLTMDFGELELAEPTSQAPGHDALPMGLGLPDRRPSILDRAPAQAGTPDRKAPGAPASDGPPAWAAAEMPSNPLDGPADVGSIGLEIGLPDGPGLELESSSARRDDLDLGSG